MPVSMVSSGGAKWGLCRGGMVGWLVGRAPRSQKAPGMCWR